MIKLDMVTLPNQRTIHPKMLLENPSLDAQGIIYSVEPRRSILGKFRGHYSPFLCVLAQPPNFPNKTARANKNLFSFDFFGHNPSISEKHQQLTNLLVAVSETHALVAMRSQIALFNSLTNQYTRVAPYDSYCLDYNPESELLCGTDSQSKILLYSLRKKKEVLNKMHHDTPLINSVRFHRGATESVMVSANISDVDFIDLEKQTTHLSVPALNNVNFTAYHPGSSLLCMAMDDIIIQVSDIRSPHNGQLYLQGHLDYNFAACFLNEHMIATGGQDTSVRLWDLRNPDRELMLFEGKRAEVGLLQYNPTNSTLYSIEKIENVNAFRYEGGQWVTDNFDFVGLAKGFCLTPSRQKMMVAVVERSYGGVMGLKLS